jgi:hypothetical protein
MNSLEQMLGRAEYQDKIEGLVEGIPATQLLSPLLDDTNPQAVLYGGRGSGKTHAIRRLGQEIPLTIQTLNKEKLSKGIIEYNVMEDAENSSAIVIDDIHYLVKAMRMSIENGDGRLSEEIVISYLQKHSQKGKKQIYVMDQSPGCMALLFTKDKNKKAFLKLLEGCIAEEIDVNQSKYHLGKYYDKGNTMCLDNRANTLQYKHTKELPINLATKILKQEEKYLNQYLDNTIWEKEWINKAKKIKSELKASNSCNKKRYDELLKAFNKELSKGNLTYPHFNIFTEKIEFIRIDKQSEFYESERKKLKNNYKFAIENSKLSESVDLIKQLGAKALETKLKDTMGSDINEQFNMTDIPYLIDINNKKSFFNKQVAIAPIRILKVLTDIYGGVNREALGLEEVGTQTENGIEYTHEELDDVRDFMMALYYDAVGLGIDFKARQLEQIVRSKNIMSAYMDIDLQQE